jgi:ABC-type Fe3+-citrate transport system substrate-binding protein
MKRQFAIFAFAAASIVFASCGSSADDEKLKAETVAIEEATIAVDSTSFEIKKTSTELDELLNQL